MIDEEAHFEPFSRESYVWSIRDETDGAYRVFSGGITVLEFAHPRYA